MTYVFMAIRYPEPGRQADLYRRMADMAESIRGVPGLIDIGPWVEHDGERVASPGRTFFTAIITHPGQWYYRAG